MSICLGVIAGSGDLPWRVVAAARAQGRRVFVLGLEGAVDAARGPDAVVRLGAAGAAIARLKAEGVDELVMAGGVRRPSLAELRPDWRAARLFARAGVRALGDDGLLRAVIGALEAEGFRVRAPQDFLGEEDFAPPGVWTAQAPDAQAQADLIRALTVAQALGTVDVGQGAVVQDGVVLAVEAIEGTDAMLARVGGLARAGAGGVLVKAAKPRSAISRA